MADTRQQQQGARPPLLACIERVIDRDRDAGTPLGVHNLLADAVIRIASGNRGVLKGDRPERGLLPHALRAVGDHAVPDGQSAAGMPALGSAGAGCYGASTASSSSSWLGLSLPPAWA